MAVFLGVGRQEDHWSRFSASGWQAPSLTDPVSGEKVMSSSSLNMQAHAHPYILLYTHMPPYANRATGAAKVPGFS